MEESTHFRELMGIIGAKILRLAVLAQDDKGFAEIGLGKALSTVHYALIP